MSTIAKRARANIRYYSGKLVERADALNIGLLGQLWYRRMPLPGWKHAQARQWWAADSALGRLILDSPTAQGDADRVLDGQLRLFGHNIVTGAPFPDWHRDYLSEHRYALKPYPLCHVAVDTGGDIICPWELSRLQFVPTLIAADYQTGDNRYRQHFYALLDNWTSSNPYLLGINWMCGLDIAIRALNIALGLSYFKPPQDSRQQQWQRLLWSHLHYLQTRDLNEIKPVQNNHLLIAAALQYGLLGLFDGDTVGTWRDQSRQIVLSQMARQFHPDGGNFESAFAYHQFSLEALLVSALLSAPLGSNPVQHIFPTLTGHAARALGFTQAYSDAYGGMPQIGDSSDGRILFQNAYFDWHPGDSAYLLETASVAGLTGDTSPAQRRPGEYCYPDSGVAIVKTASYGLVATSMPVAATAAGHNHADRTSFVLAIDGQPVLVDPGTGCYTSNTRMRNRLRGGHCHNVLIVNDEQPGALPANGVFGTPDFGPCTLQLRTDDASGLRIDMSHSGYVINGGHGIVTRQLKLDQASIEVEDRIDTQSSLAITVIFILHPDIVAQHSSANVFDLTHGDATLCSITLPAQSQVVIDDIPYSDAYHKIRSTRRIRATLRTCAPNPTLNTRIELKRQSRHA